MFAGTTGGIVVSPSLKELNAAIGDPDWGAKARALYMWTVQEDSGKGGRQKSGRLWHVHVYPDIIHFSSLLSNCYCIIFLIKNVIE